MPEVKNNFLKSRMNKDLESRILPNGEYRDARNLSISTSEGSDVGAIENIRGTISITDFNLTDTGLEIIGMHNDIQNNRIFCFITNFSDSTVLNEGLHANNFVSAKCYITLYDANSDSFNTLVSGRYLNFSKTNRIININIIEDLLFWTDDRNQPRKININTALANPSYYDSEDLISVLRYNPYNSIKFVENLANPNFTDDYGSTLINETDEFLTPHLTLPANVETSGNDYLQFWPSSSANRRVSTAFNTDPTSSSTDQGFEKYLPNTLWVAGTYAARPANTNAIPKVLVKNLDKPGTGEFVIFAIRWDVNGAGVGNACWTIDLADLSNPYIRNNELPTTWESGDTFSFSLENPYYNQAFRGDEDYLKDKFVRFSYRYKFEDSEYSLMAPFTQPAFLPKQYGSILENDENNTKDSGVIKFFENQLSTIGLTIDLPFDYDELYNNLNITAIDILLKEAGNNNVYVVETIEREDFENYIGASLTGSVPPADLPIAITNPGVDGTYIPNVITNNNGRKAYISCTVASGEITAVNILSSGGGFKENDKLTIPSGELSQSISAPSDPININISSSFLRNARQDQLVYVYKSKEPYKVVEESEITRVNDKAPVRALTQEVSGNRVMYGNYLDRINAPSSLNYTINVGKKLTTTTSTKEYPVHNLKQNRSYQVGVVLMDRYGRSSNVILSDDIFNSTVTGAQESSIFHRYVNSSIYSDAYWPGDSLRVNFIDPIPEADLYSSSNPVGWYSYKIVVKQKQQEYYNVYVPGTLSGLINWEPDNTLDWNNGTAGDEGLYKTRPNFTNIYSVSNISLTGDNINKVPRNLNEVGPEQVEYGSDSILYCRVNPNGGTVAINIFSTQTSTQDAIKKIEVDDIKPHRDLGDWAQTKGQYYPGQLEDNQSTSNLEIEPWYPFIWDSNSGAISLSKSVIEWTDLFYNLTDSPYVAKLSTEYRIGTTPSYVNPSSGDLKRSVTSVYDSLGIFETSPVNSELDILWETSTTGLISDLNESIQDSVANTQRRLSQFSFILNEADPSGTDAVNDEFATVDAANQISTDQFATLDLIRVVDAAGNNITSSFDRIQSTPGAPGSSPLFKIRSAAEFSYLGSNLLNRQFRFTFKSVVFGQAATFDWPSSTTFALLKNTIPNITGDALGATVPYYPFDWNDPTKPISNALRINLTNFWDNVDSNLSISNNGGIINSDATPKSFFPIIDFRDGTWQEYNGQTNTGQPHTYQISNGSIKTADQEKELKIKITNIRVWPSTDYEGNTNDIAYVDNQPDYFIVDSSGYRIITNPNNPPIHGKGGKKPISVGTIYSRYRIFYKLVENFTDGGESDSGGTPDYENDSYALDIISFTRSNQ